jgi:hypothetical protein
MLCEPSYKDQEGWVDIVLCDIFSFASTTYVHLMKLFDVFFGKWIRWELKLGGVTAYTDAHTVAEGPITHGTSMDMTNFGHMEF